jgi:hypothetical protein
MGRNDAHISEMVALCWLEEPAVQARVAIEACAGVTASLARCGLVECGAFDAQT